MNTRNLIVTLTASLLTFTTLAYAQTGNRKETKPEANTTSEVAKDDSTSVPNVQAAGANVETEQNGDKPNPQLPGPSQEWTKIAKFSTQEFSLFIDHWTILTLQTALDYPVDVYIFSNDGELLESFDATGCGAFLMLDEPQMVHIMVVNAYRENNAYLLNVY